MTLSCYFGYICRVIWFLVAMQFGLYLLCYLCEMNMQVFTRLGNGVVNISDGYHVLFGT